jgi:hypothetical protein
MKKGNYLFLLILILASSTIKAQDIIRTKTDTIQAKVIEIGIDEIKYREYSYPTGPVIVIEKNKVVEITFENGSKYLITPDPYDVSKEVEVRNKSRAIKFELFAPLTNDIVFGYETMIKVGTNLEFKVGIIGPGTAPNTENASGFFLKGGVKFLTSPTYLQNGVKYVHQLKGAYIKPEIIFNSYTADRSYYSSTSYNGSYLSYNTTITERTTINNLCFNINFGKQLLLGNIMTFDYYVGVGYGMRFTNHKTNTLYDYSDSEGNYEYSHLYFGKDFPLILTGGITMGVLF